MVRPSRGRFLGITLQARVARVPCAEDGGDVAATRALRNWLADGLSGAGWSIAPVTALAR